jgi:phage-related minor tail protein
MQNLNRVQQDEVKSTSNTKKNRVATTESVEQEAVAVEKLAKVKTKEVEANSNLGSSASKVDKLIQNLTNTYFEMARGMTRGEASIMNTARNMGATAEQIKEVRSALQDVGSLNRNPFDASIGAIRSITKELELLEHRTDLAGKGLVLNSKQLYEYGRIATEVTAQLKSAGVDIESSAGMTRLTSEVEKTKNAYIGYVQQVQAKSGIEKELARSQRERENAVRSLATAEEKAASMVATYSGAVQTGDAITERSALSIANYERWLKQAGVSGEQAASKLKTFSAQQAIIAAQEQKQREAYLQRAIIPQYSDLFVGLTTGMNPLTVALQQLPQIQDLFTLTGVKAQDTVKVLGNAASEMVIRLKDTAIAVTQAIGLGFANLGGQMIFLDRQMQALDTGRSFVSKFAGESSIATKAFDALAVVIRSTAALAGGVLVGGFASATVALIQTVKANNAATKALYEYGAATGLTRDELISLANTSASYGTSSNEMKGFFGELIKGGVKSKEVLQSAADGATYFRAVTGESLEDIGKRFIDLGKEPVKALTELAKNTGLVTVATIEGIEYLIKQGDTLGANALAAEIYSQALQQLAKDQYNALTPLEQLWISVKIAGGEAWQSVLDFANSPVVVNGLKGIALAGLAIVSVLREIGQSGISAFKALSNPLSAGAVWEDWKAQINIIRTDAAKMRDEIIFGNQGIDASNRQTNASAASGLAEQKKLREELSKAAEAGVSKEQKALADTARIHELYRKNIIAAGDDEQKRLSVVKDYELALAGLNKETKKSSSADKEANETLSYYNKTLEKFRDLRIQATKAESDTSKSVELTTKAYAALQDTLDDVGKDGVKTWDKLSAAEKESILIAWEHAQAAELTTLAYKEQKKALESLQKVWDKFNLERMKEQEAISQANEDLAFQYSILGKSESAVRKMTNAYEEQKKINKINLDYKVKELQLIQNAQREIEKTNDPFERLAQERILENAKESLAIERVQKIGIAQEETNLKVVQHYQKIWDDIQGGVADALYTALSEGGKKGAIKIKDLIKAQLKKLAMEPITFVAKIIVDTGRALAGMALDWLTGGSSGGGLGTALGLTSNASSAYNLVNAVSGAYSALTTGAGALPLTTGAANAVGAMGGDSLGTLISLNPQWSSSVGTQIGQSAGQAMAKTAAAPGSTSMWATVGSAVAGGLSAYGVGQAVGQKYGTVAGTAAGTLAGVGTYAVGSAVAGGAFAGGAAAGMAGVYSALAAIPVWGWIAAGVLALFGATSGKKPKLKGDVVNSLYVDGVLQTQETEQVGKRSLSGGDALAAMSEGFAAVYGGLLKEFGKEANFALSAFYRTRTNGLGHFLVDGNKVAGAKGKKYSIGDLFNEVMSTGLTKAITQSDLPEQIKRLFEGFKIGDIEGVQTTIAAVVNMNTHLKTLGTTLQDFIGSMDFEAYRLEGERNVDIVSRMLTSVLQMNAVFDKLNFTLFDLSSAAFGAITQLEDAFGGAQGLMEALNTYYDNYFSAEEKRLNIIKDMGKQLQIAGADMTRLNLAEMTRLQYRELIEGTIAAKGATDPLTIALIKLSGVFASVTEEVESATKAEEERLATLQRLEEERLVKLRSSTDDLYSVFTRLANEQIEALKGASKETDAALAALSKAIDTEKKIKSDEISNLEKRTAEYSKVISSLSESIKSLRKTASATAAMIDDEAKRIIASALAGNSVDSEVLLNAASTRSGTVESALYSTKVEKDRAFIILSNELESIKDTAVVAETADEIKIITLKKQLVDLDLIYDEAKKQVNTLRGIDTSVLSVDQAIRNLHTKIAEETGAKQQIALIISQLGAAKLQYDELRGINQGVSDLTKAFDDLTKALAVEQRVKTTSPYVQQQVQSMVSAGQDGTGVGVVGNPKTAIESQISEMFKEILGRDVAQSGLDYYSSMGGTLADIRYSIENSLEAQLRKQSIDLQNQFLAGVSIALTGTAGSIKAYDVGANVIPNDQLAMIHKNEAIIPAKFNPWAGGTLPVDNSELAEAIVELRNELNMLRYEARATATNTAKMAKQLDRTSGEQDTLKVQIVTP